MKAEFFKDYNGDVWFYYCRDIHFRHLEGAQDNGQTAKAQAKQLQQSKEVIRKQKIADLEHYESQ